MKERLSTAKATLEVLEYLANQLPCNCCNCPLFESFIGTILPFKEADDPSEVLIEYRLCSRKCFNTMTNKI
jgi:hypothetical protein